MSLTLGYVKRRTGDAARALAKDSTLWRSRRVLHCGAFKPGRSRTANGFARPYVLTEYFDDFIAAPGSKMVAQA
jgi:hypothetical protein